MKRLAPVSLTILSIAIVMGAVGCAGTLTPATAPRDCSKSVIESAAPWSYVALEGMVVGVYLLAESDPEKYATLKTAARQAEAILGGDGATIAKLYGLTGMNSLLPSVLCALFHPEQVIDACDRKVLIDYLKRI